VHLLVKDFFLLVKLILTGDFEPSDKAIICANVECFLLRIPKEADSLTFKVFAPEFLIGAIGFYKAVHCGHTHDDRGFFLFPRHFEVGQIRVHTCGEGHLRIENKETARIHKTKISDTLGQRS
jgi:hypothetical protein